MKSFFPVLSVILVCLSGCGITSTDSYIEVYGEAYFEPVNNNPVVNLYFNGSSEQQKEFKKWLDQAIPQPERRRIQNENYFYQGMYGEGGQEFQVNISYLLTFDNPDAFRLFAESVIKEKFPVSFNSMNPFELAEQDLQREAEALKIAKSQAIEKISRITGNPNPQVISFRQIRAENFQEYVPVNSPVKVTVLVRAKK
jgi:hypothetical protein